MEEEDDDMYAPAEPVLAPPAGIPANISAKLAADTPSNGANADEDDEMDEGDDDGEEDEDEEDDDDIQIITQRAPGASPVPPAGPQRTASGAVRIEAAPSATPQPGASSTPASGTAAAAAGAFPPPAPISVVPSGIGRTASPTVGVSAQGQYGGGQRPGSSYPEVKSSILDLEANPALPATGKPIFSTDMDGDFAAADTAPWRRPGSDMTDYYNYGFDEGTWAAYCMKQRAVRGEVAEDRKRMEQLQAMMGGGGMGFGAGGPAGAGSMPGMDPASAAAAAAAAAGMPGMPSMEQMMQMMSGGGMPGMDMGMGGTQQSFPGQGGYGGGGAGGGGGGRNQGGRGKRW